MALVTLAAATVTVSITAEAQTPVLCDGKPATMVGTSGNDRILGTDGDDVIAGLDGNDVIRGFGGNDTICGDNGRDRIFGGPGNDTLLGGKKNDIVKGDQGRDEVYGNQGKDRLVGGGGPDILEGGSGIVDRLWGKGGNDTCIDPQSFSTIYDTCELGTPPQTQHLVPDGPAELVYDWSTDHCEDLTLPDIATRVVRGPDGMLRLYIGNLDTYPMVGPDFDSLEIDCSEPVMTSDFDPDPAQFNDNEWIGATYTEDGQTVYAIIHNEYLGADHTFYGPDQCATVTHFECIDSSLTLGISTDGGVTYRDAFDPPGHLIATLPYPFDDEGRPSGVWQPSNLIAGEDGYLYLLVNVSTYPTSPAETMLNWVCAMRTDDIADPGSWRYWNGTAFEGVWINPYLEDPGPLETAETCAPVDFPALESAMSESIVWSDRLGSYIIVGGTHEPGDPGDTGIYYSTSTDLIDWTPRRRLIDLPVPGDITLADTMPFVGYPTLLDHDSPSLNFDTVDDRFHLYVTRFNGGTSSLDRDLLRYPIRIVSRTLKPSVWDFDAGPEGWAPDFDIGQFAATGGALRLTSTGDDPYFSTTGLEIPAEYTRATITMSVTGGDNFAQLFFLGDNLANYTEDTVIGFEVVGDGRMRTYQLDMSTIPAWDGIVTALRFDPVTTAGTTVAIDRISVGP